MSHSGGGLETLRRSASPGTLKRKRDGTSSPSTFTKAAKLTSTTSSTTSRLGANASADLSKHYRSPDSDEALHSEAGDTLHGVGSASSHTSTASTIFSSSSQALAQHHKSSLLNGLTPLTSISDSSPPKQRSPSHAQTSFEMSTVTGDAHALAAGPTPEPPIAKKERPQMLPPPGKAKGYRVVWDPELDGKLSKEERKRATLRKREFGTEVRYIFHRLLSLRNIIHIT